MKRLKIWLFDIVIDGCLAAMQARDREILPSSSDKAQIIFALRRAEHALRMQANALLEQRDYSAEFPDADADRMVEAIRLIRTLR